MEHELATSRVFSRTERLLLGLGLLLAASSACGSGLDSLVLEGHELHDEINEKLFACELELMDFALDHFATVVPQPQDAAAATSYPRRKPDDSRIDPTRSIAEQFNLLRVADPERYPAFFEWQGHRYEITLRKASKP